MNWIEQFKPMADKGWGIRTQQKQLGDSIINTLRLGGILIGQASTGTGKSVASVVPLIHKIKESKADRSTYRAVISTETLTLQSQLDNKDLPMLKEIYGGFTFKKLMGRSNYLCFNRAKEMVYNNPEAIRILKALETKNHAITSGEKGDIERVLGREITKDDWFRLSGDSKYCSENQCDPQECFSMRARAEALKADIVVCNHKILAIDYDMKQRGSENGMLGPFNTVVVDEAHTLADVLCDSWAESYSEYDIHENLTKFLKGASDVERLTETKGFGDKAAQFDDLFRKFFNTTKKFFASLEGKDWDGSENPFCMQFVPGTVSQYTLDLMEEFETTGPALFNTFSNAAEEMDNTVLKAMTIMADPDSHVGKESKKNIRKTSSGLKYLTTLAKILGQAIESRDGIVEHNGLTYGVTLRGWVKRDTNENKMTITANPIDIASKARKIWEGCTSSILISATLEDLTANDFKFFKRSLGVQVAKEIRVGSAFNMQDQQLVYVSDRSNPPEDGTVFAMEELVDAVNQAQGRSLVLFTSRRDLNMAREKLNAYKAAGRFPYVMLVQEPDSDKGKLVEDFKSNTFSVLLGLKSMFTGIDIPGESLSLVVICRFPLPRYSAECKMKIKYWKDHGFRNWYSRESLTVFQQAAGRLIRSDKCIGVVAIIDQRVSTAGSNVFKTAKIGIDALGSRVTWNINDIGRHISQEVLSAV